MSYKIVIEKIEEYEITGRQYQKISDTGNEKDGGKVYGYVDCPETIIRKTEILKQEVDEIDLIGVIKAINKID